MSDEERGLASRLKEGRTKYWGRVNFDLNIPQQWRLALVLTDYIRYLENDYKDYKETDSYKNARFYLEILGYENG